ncbi:right-handed parallel beta-helix repeat-containing protein [Saliphagus sp. GCM10025334]|uniref:right-handed parallel beta-helix repeat-containing protein n=1 Tax=Natronosalvus caseinilyticus TaxID=2953747 RepID=UPI0028A7C7DB|nr:right-handed parallel beta-helix repeat-containing protein [Natronosalvus caseinilyticus]
MNELMNGTENDSNSSTSTEHANEKLSSCTSCQSSRRTFVKGAAIAGISALGLSSTAAASGSYTKYDGEYRHVVNVVEAGADNTGNKSITPVLRNIRNDNTLFYFPPGRYAMDSQLRFTGFDNVAFIGNDATLVPANHYNFEGPKYRLFRLGVGYRPGRRLRFEGFDVDQTAPDTGIRVIEAHVSDRLEVRDINIEGQHDSGTWGPGLFNVTSSSGYGIVERFRAADGGEWIDNTPTAGERWRGPTGILANQNAGTLEFKHCTLGAFPDNGLYAAGGTGKIIVSGGTYRNSNGANIRVGGNGSEINWPTVTVDDTRPEDVTQRGIRIENGQNLRIKGAAVNITSPMPTSHAISTMGSCESARIERIHIDMQGNDVNHGIVVSPNAGEITIVETKINHETAGGYPLWIRNTNATDRVLAEYLTITGEAGDASGFRDSIRVERDNCRFNAIEVTQSARSGAKRNAITSSANDLTVWMSTLRASQFPVVELGSGSTYLDIDAESYSGREAACLYDQSRNISMRNSRLINGVRDLGSSSLTLSNNTTA